MLGVNASTVANDLRALHNEGRQLDRPIKSSYASRLAVYVDTFMPDVLGVDSDVSAAIQRVLYDGLLLDNFLAVSYAMIDGINMARVPKIPPHLWNTQRLVYAIFGRAAKPVDEFFFAPSGLLSGESSVNLIAEMVWKWHPQMLDGGFVLHDMVKDHVDLARQFVAFRVYGGYATTCHVAPINSNRPADTRVDVVVNDAIKERIGRGLAKLDERQRRVLSLRYPEDGTEGKTLSEVGKIMGLSRERIRRIELEALDQMQRFLVEGGVDMHPVSTTATALANNRYFAGRFVANTFAVSDLADPISALDLSVRAAEIAQELGAAHISDLAGMGDGDILHAPGGGLSVLNEVKAKLGGIGLSLGTLISDSKED